MFEATALNRRNQTTQRLFRLALGGMTAILVLPVILIMGTLLWKGAPVISFEFLFTGPTQGMTAGGIFPALLGTILLVLVALSAAACGREPEVTPAAPTVKRLPSPVFDGLSLGMTRAEVARVHRIRPALTASGKSATPRTSRAPTADRCRAASHTWRRSGSSRGPARPLAS